MEIASSAPKKMKEILFEFAEDDKQNIHVNQETISAMGIYTRKKMRMESTAS